MKAGMGRVTIHLCVNRGREMTNIFISKRHKLVKNK